jgi:hypothetical protein
VTAETAVQLVRAGQPVASLFALRRGLAADAAAAEFRAMTSPDMRRQALCGFLTTAAAGEFIAREWGNPVLGLASQWQLPADSWRPGLCRATAVSNGGAAALRLAANLPWEPAVGRAMLRDDILKAWALTDLPGLRRHAEHPENADVADPARKAIAAVMPLIPEPEIGGPRALRE